LADKTRTLTVLDFMLKVPVNTKDLSLCFRVPSC